MSGGNRFMPIEVRFWTQVDVTASCWIWKGRIRHGYGAFQTERRQLTAHRVAYERLVGPIPEGMTLDHLCLVKACVNPAHLEVVTRGENARRWALARTHCKHGHQFSFENTSYRRRKSNNGLLSQLQDLCTYPLARQACSQGRGMTATTREDFTSQHDHDLATIANRDALVAELRGLLHEARRIIADRDATIDDLRARLGLDVAEQRRGT